MAGTSGASLLLLMLLALPLSVLADVSNRLEAGYTGDATASSPSLELSCSANADSQAEWTACSWSSPGGSAWQVSATDGSVVLVAGEVQGEMEVTAGGSTDAQTCAIQADGAELGAWTCTVTLDGVSEYQRAVVNAIAETRVSDVRIDTSVLAEEYDVYLTPKFDDLTIPGRVTAYLTAQVDAVDTVRLHIKDMTVYEDTVSVTVAGQGAQIAGFEYDGDREFFNIILLETMAAGDTVVVDLSFMANLRDDLAGFYRSSYDQDGTTEYLAITQFQSTDARKAFPCMDEPALKAVFNVHLGRTDQYTSASNMPIEVEGENPVDGLDGYVWDEYFPTERMSSYLVAFLVSKFERRISDAAFGEEDDGEFGVWAQPDLFEQTEYASVIGPQILDFYASEFEIPFPLPKQDMAAIPDLSFGGMENWGLVTYREVALLFEEGVSSEQSRDYIDGIVAHELAHQWFGDLVTMEWWSDLWLNEGFATFMSYRGAEFVSPDFAQFDRFILDNNFQAYDLDAYESSHAISVDVGHPDEINELFDDISYEKGAALIRMMDAFLTADTFNKGINNYLLAFQYSNANQDDLWDQLTVAADEDGVLDDGLTVKEIMDTWTTKKGVPVVTVTRTGDDTVTVEQKRFLLGPKDESDDTVYSWWVPLSYDVIGGDFTETAPKDWLPYDVDSMDFVLEGNVLSQDVPVIFNVLSTNYYRVNYDDTTWLALADALRADPNSVAGANRAQILNDALNVAREGSLRYDVALAQTDYLDLEVEYVPWSSASSSLAYVSLMLSRTDAAADINAYIEGKVEHLYGLLGYDPSPDDTFYDVLLRSLTLSLLCGYDYPECAERAVQDFDDWEASPNPDSDASNPIDVEVRDTAYCTAIRNGDEDDWDFLFVRFQNTDNSDEASTILSALACSTDPVILTEYINMVLPQENGIRSGDALNIVSSIAANPVGAPIAWDWMQTEWEQIHEELDTAVSSPVARMVEAVTAGFNTQEELDELQAFYDDNFDILGTAQRATETALETTEANIAWMDANFDSLACWLEEGPDADCGFV